MEAILLAASVLLIVSILASKASHRLGVPALLLFLLIGMLAGSEGPGGIHFDDPWLAQALGVVALAFILFSGGLDTDWQVVRPVAWEGAILSTLGVLLTAALMGGFAVWALGFTWREGLLLGAIVASTDAAAVFAVLRSRSAQLGGKLEPLLEFESGSNDPMAVFLTVGLIQLLADPAASPASLVPLFVQQMAIGAALGYAMGRATTWLVNRVRLEYEGLYPVLTLSVVLLIYGATAALGGNGFLAVYLAGLVLGNSKFLHKASLLRFHDGLAWLMQITMFLALGLLVFPSQLLPVAGLGLLASLFLMLVGRPASVFVSLAFSRLSVPEKALVAWMGLRGAVPIILATFPLVAGIPRADTIFNLVFFIVLASVLVQGTSVPKVGRLLGVVAAVPPRVPYPLEILPTPGIRSQMVDVIIPRSSPAVGKAVVDLDLPKGVLIVLLRKGAEFIVPSGSTVIEAGDTMLVLADTDALARVWEIVGAPGPLDRS